MDLRYLFPSLDNRQNEKYIFSKRKVHYFIREADDSIVSPASFV